MKLGIILITIGVFIASIPIRNYIIENIPNDWLFPLGVAIVILGMYKLKKW